MNNILLKLVNGQTKFKCEWKGEPNECVILMLNFETEKAFVRFKTPVKKMVRREFVPTIDTISVLDDQMYDVEVETNEEWISVPFNETPTEFKYEHLFISEDGEPCPIDGWVPIATNRIKHPEKIPEYIASGRLRLNQNKLG